MYKLEPHHGHAIWRSRHKTDFLTKWNCHAGPLVGSRAKPREHEKKPQTGHPDPITHNAQASCISRTNQHRYAHTKTQLKKQKPSQLAVPLGQLDRSEAIQNAESRLGATPWFMVQEAAGPWAWCGSRSIAKPTESLGRAVAVGGAVHASASDSLTQARGPLRQMLRLGIAGDATFRSGAAGRAATEARLAMLART